MRKKWKIMILILLLCLAAGGGIFFAYKVRCRTEETIIHTEDGKQIYGILYRPRYALSCPLVVLGHGYGGRYSDNMDYGRYFAEHGIACYVFDFCGASDDSQSTMVDRNLYTEIEDMNDIADYMLQQSWLKEGGLYLAGKSLGGTVAALTASERPDDVGGLILHYPFFVYSDAFKQNEDDENRPLVPDIFNTIAKFEGPVLIFNGDEDKYVPLEYTRQAEDAYKDARLFVIEGSGHGFSGKDRSFVKEQMVSFVNEHS